MIKEKCSCGAEIMVEYRESSWQVDVVENWRKDHKHEDVLKKTRDEVYEKARQAEIDLKSRMDMKENNIDWSTSYSKDTNPEEMSCSRCDKKFNLTLLDFKYILWQDRIEIIHQSCPGK
jgi:hypothetical protein